MDLSLKGRPIHELTIQRPPVNLGKVFYVLSGAPVGHEGTDPNYPLSTVALALAKCRSNKNDHIFVFDHWVEAATPIVVDVDFVSILGLAAGYGLRTIIRPTGDTDVFRIGNNVGYAEIAGFDLGGGVGSAGIDIYNAYGAWIHDNTFGHPFAQDTPLYGIQSTLGSPANCLIEDNIFMGHGKADGKITSNGIYVVRGDTATMQSTIIRRNLFLGLTGVVAGAILLDGVWGWQILDNKFHVVDEDDGCAINLLDESHHCFVEGNRAAHGRQASENTFNPYRDMNGVDDNGWGDNLYNGVLTEPVTV